VPHAAGASHVDVSGSPRQSADGLGHNRWHVLGPEGASIHAGVPVGWNGGGHAGRLVVGGSPDRGAVMNFQYAFRLRTRGAWLRRLKGTSVAWRRADGLSKRRADRGGVLGGKSLLARAGERSRELLRVSVLAVQGF
jgi:hypothetical protein